MTRRLPALVLVIAAFVALIVSTRQPIEADTPTFSISASGWMPSAPPATGLTETWFCPGVPASGIDGAEGSIVIANRHGERLIGTILLINDRQESQRLEVAIDPWVVRRRRPRRHIAGGDGRRSDRDRGWRGAGRTAGVPPVWQQCGPVRQCHLRHVVSRRRLHRRRSLDQIVLTNPYEQTVVVNSNSQPARGRGAPIRTAG